MKEVLEYIDNNKQKFVSDLQRLCRQPSISAQNKGILKCADLVKRMMDEVGITSEVFPVKDGFPVVFGELKSKNATKTIGFYNHYDVQPPEPLDQWTSPPFEAEIREGRIYARGVEDNKGNLVARLKATEALVKTYGSPPVNMKFFVDGEEEIGSPHLESFVKDHMDLLKADGYIWEGDGVDEKNRPMMTLGVKGIINVEFRAKGANRDVHAGRAPIVPNPAWRLIWLLASIKGSDERIKVDEWYENVKGPTEEDMALLKDLPFEEKTLKEDLGLEEFVKGATGLKALTNLYFNPTCNICGFDSGYKGPGPKTILPSTAMAKVDFRLVPNQKVEVLFEKLKLHMRKFGFTDVEVVKLAGYEPSKISAEAPFPRLVINTVKNVYGTDPVIKPVTPGSSPIYTIQNWMGIPVVSAGGVSNAQSKAHAPNENIRVSDYLRSIKFIATLANSYRLT